MKKERQEAARDQLLQVAKRLFAKYGFHGTTVRMIADKAHVGVAKVNYYFGSKEALYEEIFNRGYHFFSPELSQLVGSVHDQASWRKALEGWFGFMLDLFLLDTPERSLFRNLISHERAVPTGSCTTVLRDVFDPVVGILRDLMRMALPDAPEPVFQAAFIVALGQCTCFMHRNPPWDEIEVCKSVPREEWIRLVREEILTNLTARYSYKTNRIRRSSR